MRCALLTEIYDFCNPAFINNVFYHVTTILHIPVSLSLSFLPATQLPFISCVIFRCCVVLFSSCSKLKDLISYTDSRKSLLIYSRPSIIDSFCCEEKIKKKMKKYRKNRVYARARSFYLSEVISEGDCQSSGKRGREREKLRACGLRHEFIKFYQFQR